MIFPGDTTFGSIIESLTSGIYDGNSNCIREYVQNGIDSGSKKIDIYYQNQNNDIVIRDYGKGMDENELVNALTLGNSNKSRPDIGWRGIGIYSGIPNFKKIVITTRKYGGKKLTVEIDSEHIRREYLKSPQPTVNDILEGGISDLVKEDDDDFAPGTKVSLINIEPSQRTVFDPQRLKNKLIRVLPLPLREDLIFKDEIIKVLKSKNIQEPDFEIFFNKEKLYRPPTDDSIFDPESFVSGCCKADDGTDLFVFWAITSKYNKEIESNKPEYDRLNRGIIFKLKGMTIGDERSPEITVSNLFSGKYNFWNYGEIHVLDPDIRENAGRNNFETLTGHSTELFKKVGILIGNIQKINRQKSSFDKSSRIENVQNRVNSGTISKKEAIKELEKIKKGLDGETPKNDGSFLKPYNKILEERTKEQLKQIEELGKTILNSSDDNNTDYTELVKRLPPNIKIPILRKIKNQNMKLTTDLFSDIENELIALTGVKREEFNKLVTNIFALEQSRNREYIKNNAKLFIIDPEKLYNDAPGDPSNQKYTYLIHANFGEILLGFYQIFVNGEKHHSKTFNSEWYSSMGKEDKELFLYELGCTLDLLERIVKLSKPRNKIGSSP